MEEGGRRRVLYTHTHTHEPLQPEEELPPGAKVRDQVEFFGGLKGALEGDNERVVHGLQDLTLRTRVLELPPRMQHVLLQGLDGVHGPPVQTRQLLRQKYLAKGALAHHRQQLEVLYGHLGGGQGPQVQGGH